MSGKKIAFFDFDGTITTGDSLLELIKFIKGKRSFYTGFILNAHWVVAYKLNLIRNDIAKQRVLTYFFSGMSEFIFQEKCDLFIKLKLPDIIRAAAITEIEHLRKDGFEIVVVSASGENWIRKWSDRLSLELVATRLAVENGLITGKIEGKNCYGIQKVVCIMEKWNMSDYKEIYAYGDSPGDRPMLSLATKSFYKPFRTA